MRHAIRNAVCFLCLLALCAVVGGCAVGRGQAGEPVVGFRLGPPDPETLTEFGGLASTLFPQAAPIIGIATAAIGGLWGTYAHAKRKGERAGWDEAVGVPSGTVARRPGNVPVGVPAVASVEGA